MLYLKKNKNTTNRTDPDPEYIHRELKRKNVTLTLLWYEHKLGTAHPDGLMYSQFCERYRQWLCRSLTAAWTSNNALPCGHCRRDMGRSVRHRTTEPVTRHAVRP